MPLSSSRAACRQPDNWYAGLSADNQTFSGSAGLFIQPEHGSDCVKSWPFTVTRVPSVSVPSVVEMTVLQARSTLANAGLRSSLTSEIDRTCSTLPGRIMRQNPDADTPVQLDSVVEIVRAIKPPACP
jgi:beta-lactam-binding protein with PASTA domain